MKQQKFHYSSHMDIKRLSQKQSIDFYWKVLWACSVMCREGEEGRCDHHLLPVLWHDVTYTRWESQIVLLAFSACIKYASKTLDGHVFWCVFEHVNPGISTELSRFTRVKYVKQVPGHYLKSTSYFCDTRLRNTRCLYRHAYFLLYPMGRLAARNRRVIAREITQITSCAHTLHCNLTCDDNMIAAEKWAI